MEYHFYRHIFSLMEVEKCVHVICIFTANGEITVWEIIIPLHPSVGDIVVLQRIGLFSLGFLFCFC